ncbi:MAG: CPBP family glutamic-type intramembrane protease [Crocinitomicaceae bacterium]|jgi:membrane protease YdiL (CAAX protease family)|tara:strand:- start:15880 stop:16626 length:747 start_codon:yes stop_codon:yes gene_type:complete
MFHSLDVDLSWKSGDLVSFLPIILALVFFIIYWFTASSPTIKTRFYNKYSFDQASFKHIFFTKIFGFVSMGVLPICICLIFLEDFSLTEYGLTYIPETTMYSLAWIIGLSALLIPLVNFSAKKAKNLVNYPQIRSKVWTRKMVYMNALGWFLYLFGYEFLFRGVLLFPLIEPLGVWPAIAVNIALYSATHIPKGLDETIGAIPLGLVLCLLTLSSGTIWIAFFVHVAMAWTNTFTALKHNPETNYHKS